MRLKIKVSSVPLQYQAQSHATCGSQSKLIHHQALLLPYRSSIFFVSSVHSRSNSLTIVSSGIAYSLFIALIRSISKHKHNSLSCSQRCAGLAWFAPSSVWWRMVHGRHPDTMAKRAVGEWVMQKVKTGMC